MVIVAQSSVPPFAPSVQTPIFEDASTVGTPTSSINHFLPFQRFYQVWCIHVSAKKNYSLEETKEKEMLCCKNNFVGEP